MRRSGSLIFAAPPGAADKAAHAVPAGLTGGYEGSRVFAATLIVPDEAAHAHGTVLDIDGGIADVGFG